MRLRRHVTSELAAEVDRQLSPADRQYVRSHVASCDSCRREMDDIRFTDSLLRSVPLVTAPDAVWASIEAALDGAQAHAPRVAWRPLGLSLRWAPAIALVVLIAGAAYWLTPGAATWEVRVANAAAEHLPVGSWIETGGSSRSRITVGTIGTVDVEPNSRVRLGTTNANEYRIELARGTISAEIVAPPRLFFVDTPTTTVVDLGCAYTMHVADDGAGEMRVTSGWASFESGGRESLVPAGARARTRPGAAPGTPFFEDATPRLQAAVDTFDFAPGGTAALDVILAEARVRDTLTLWHLLARVAADQRGQVFDRIAALAPPPATVSREQALALDRATLTRWREELAWTW